MPSLRSRSRLGLATFVVVLLGSACAMAAFALGPHQASTRRTPQYISLGDSLAAGLQPDPHGVDRPSGNGYADILGRRLRKTYPGLVTHRLSCGGGTTRTLLNGGAACQRHDEPSQLVQAERILAAHPETRLVTINIGDNDVEQCVQITPPRIDSDCVRRGRAAISRNLPRIAQRLHAAAAPGTPVVGILDYDQFLAMWLGGPADRVIARRSVGLITSLNALMARIYRRAGLAVADAGTRFATTDLSTPAQLQGVGTVPRAVERICRWTWACSPEPIGSDDHARTAGYAQIAQTVLDALAHP